jgi:predicted deacetylase
MCGATLNVRRRGFRHRDARQHATRRTTHRYLGRLRKHARRARPEHHVQRKSTSHRHIILSQTSAARMLSPVNYLCNYLAAPAGRIPRIRNVHNWIHDRRRGMLDALLSV